MKTPRKGLSAGFSSRRRVFRNCSGLRFVPPWPWACCYTWSTTWGAQMPLRSAKGHVQAGDQCSCRCWSRGYPLKPQLHRGCEGGQHERLPNQQPCGMAGKRGERFAAFNAEILAFERAAGRLRHSPAAEVRSPTPERERLLVGNEELPRQTNRKWICHESAPTSRMLALAAR